MLPYNSEDTPVYFFHIKITQSDFSNIKNPPETHIWSLY